MLPKKLVHLVIFTSQVVSRKRVQEVVTVALKPLQRIVEFQVVHGVYNTGDLTGAHDLC